MNVRLLWPSFPGAVSTVAMMTDWYVVVSLQDDVTGRCHGYLAADADVSSPVVDSGDVTALLWLSTTRCVLSVFGN